MQRAGEEQMREHRTAIEAAEHLPFRFSKAITNTDHLRLLRSGDTKFSRKQRSNRRQG